MSKFNAGTTRRATGPITTEASPSTQTYEGAPGYIRDAKGELFLLAVANMVGEDTFYEKAGDRDERYAALVRQVAVTDFDWLARMLVWLRSEGNMRSAPIVGACEAVKAQLEVYTEHGAGRRQLIDAVCQRADEPAELLAYWTSRYGKTIPKPIKRGVADAAARLYSERSLLKYDTAKGFRFGDVLELTHASPAPDKAWQGELFRHAIDRRHNRNNEIPESLTMLRKRADLMAVPVEQRRTYLNSAVLKGAGITWEALSGWLQSPMDQAAWEAVIPSMGYMALLRNLRNFDEAGVSDEVAATICAKLADPEQVATSRQFPFRFYSAYANAPSQRWGHALEKALAVAVKNIPTLGGRTLILVDTSASMRSGISERSKVSPAIAAALFGVALSVKGEAMDLVGFADGSFSHPVKPSSSVLREVERFVSRIGEVGHGTDIAGSLRRTFRGHDRVVIISDMQTIGRGHGVSEMVPPKVPIYAFNLGGLKPGTVALGPYRHEFGSLVDSTFRMLPLLERGRDANYPF